MMLCAVMAAKDSPAWVEMGSSAAVETGRTSGHFYSNEPFLIRGS